MSIEAICHQARTFKDLYPQAMVSLEKSTLVDDLLDSRPTEEEALQVQVQTAELLEKKLNMKMRKWASSSEAVLAQIPKEDQATTLNIKGLDPVDGSVMRTLGLIYLTGPDIFTFSYHPNATYNNPQYLCNTCTRGHNRLLHCTLRPLG